MALATIGVNGFAQEAPANYPISSAPEHPVTITVEGSATALGATITGVIGDNTDGIPDVDFYSFEAKAGDVLTFDINGNGADTYLAVFGPWPAFQMLMENTDRAPGQYDALIDKYVVPADGVYTVGISTYPIYLDDGGTLVDLDGLGMAYSGGPYTLAISGTRVPPPVGGGGGGEGGGGGGGTEVKQITIDIKPGDRKRTSIVSMKRDYVPVALLSSKGPNEFKPLEVDQKTLTFGVNGDEPSVKQCFSHRGMDLNRDRIPDMVCLFDMDATGFEVGHLQGVLKGKTKGNVQFEGRGMLKVVHGKKKGHHRHDWRDRDDDRRDGRRGRDRDRDD
jgi:Bacterial pre-peptidase C-terminal domain